MFINNKFAAAFLLALTSVTVQGLPVVEDNGKVHLTATGRSGHLQTTLEVPMHHGGKVAADHEDEDEDTAITGRPTQYESTILARRLLAKSKSGVLTTVFPSHLTSPRVPAAVADTPIGLPEYIASCEEPTGNPTVLSLKISTATINANAGSNVSLSLSWWDEYVHLTHQQPWSAANLPRLNLVGYLEEIPQPEADEAGIPTCFVAAHPDSAMWLPGKKWAAHQGIWTRIVVQEVYWIGGFGDRNYIGWFDPEEWRAVTKEQWEAVRLPGEK
ncbi:hypothetical protein PV10_05582 [Exophiala mesophila]|uniref:CREG-like beta-barrel domain-containing protein n=1 Tax=Exophiala mesophila TaxID=212818 RepID=A0A0D1ZW49_EXOME|nr:uncharacterized protein PV10_05582 [Exophiala mesophila]KIV90988.1 hypothetical protein PV10_05582 [Exophiala mesophila]